jgi:ubiquinone/menaquinone biosynthesis C-methylase UbiE
LPPPNAHPPQHRAAEPLAPGKLANYESQRGAHAYRQDHEQKLHRQLSTRLEKKIYTKLLGDLRCDLVLDLPSGYGRLFPLLREHAPRVIEADWSGSMLALNREEHAGAAFGYLRCSALEIPLPDGAVDLAVSVRLSHHLEQQSDRERHLRELFRVARRGVLLSYFSFHSLKNRLRRLRAPFDKKPPKNTLRTARVRALGTECGFALRAAVPLSRLGSGHVFTFFERA